MTDALQMLLQLNRAIRVALALFSGGLLMLFPFALYGFFLALAGRKPWLEAITGISSICALIAVFAIPCWALGLLHVRLTKKLHPSKTHVSAWQL